MEYDVTIGIPVYRAVDFIENTLISALNQTFQSIEFLVVDDCGGDGSMDVVNRLKADHPRGSDICILSNSRNFGAGGSRNRILDEARGKYLFFLDSDDLLEPDVIQCLVDEMRNKQLDVVYGSIKRIDKVHFHPDQLYVFPDIYLLSDNEMAYYAFKNYSSFQISVCNCLMNMDFLRSNQLRFINAIFWEDLAFSYEMVTKVKRGALLSKITYHYICRSGSLSHYQDRAVLDKTEIMKNVQTIGYLKNRCKALLDKPYLPYLCYNLEMNSFYIVCYVLKSSGRIFPPISYSEIRYILQHPLSLIEILHFRRKLFHNMFFWLLNRMSFPLIMSCVKLLGKYKRVL
jgi:glycosyltransferase involved in cell wall biosynthesis